MRPLEDIEQSVASEICTGETPDALAAVQRPNCAAAIWRREVELGLAGALAGIEAEQLPTLRTGCALVDVQSVVSRACSQSGMEAEALREALTNDIGALTVAFSSVMKTDAVALRLDVITDDACRRFHTDNVEARLLCTYRGAGTQYGLEHDTDNEPPLIHQLRTGDVAIFRGAKWPGAERSAVVHRSPPIEKTTSLQDRVRLLLVVDMPSAG